MKEYVCSVCGYVYKPKENNNVEFDSLPETYVCPLCNAKKDKFEEII